MQLLSLEGSIPSCFIAEPSGGLEVERFSNEFDGLGERRGTDPERSFDDAGLTADILREVEDRRLALA